VKKKLFWFIDYILLPFLIAFLVYHPYYKHGLCMTWDEGSPLSWANAIQLHQVPLKDFFINFGPLFAYLTTFILGIFGNTLSVFRTFMFFGSMISVIAAYFLARQLIKNRIMLVVLCWYLASACLIPYWMSKWGGVRCLAMIIPVIFLFRCHATQRITTLVWSGIVSALCFLITMEAGLVAIAVFITLILQYPKEKLFRVAAFSFPFFIITSVFYLLLIFQGASLEMLYLNLIQSPFAFFDYYKNPPRVALIPFLTPFGVSLDAWMVCLQSGSFGFIFAVLLFVSGMVYMFIKRRDSDKRFQMLFVFALMMFILGVRGFTGPEISGPQFRWGLVGVGIIAVFFLDKLIFPIRKGISGEKIRVLVVKAICIFVLFLGLVFSKITPEYLIYLRERFVDIELPKPIEQNICRIGDSLLVTRQAEIFADVTKWIQSHTNKEDYIYAFPHEPHFYFLTNRRCPDIFTNSLDAGMLKGLQEKTVANIIKKNVVYAILVKDSFAVMGNAQVPNEKRIPIIYEYFSENFTPVVSYDNTIILKRK